MLSVRIVTSDHSMDDPIPGLDVTYSSFRGSVVKKVPVIRIFGPDSAGVKTCLHIHGVFPYIFIPCVEAEPDGKMQYQLASSLDLALNISLGQTSSTSQHVFKVVLVSGTPFYGYHQTSHQYFKIFFYNPSMVKKAAELLQSGAILNKVYQVHHSHIPYNLQFFIDYNLRGMDYISLEAVKYRRHPSNCLTPEWANEDMLLPSHIPRLSVSEVEADGMAGDILNVRSMSLEMNPGLADIWNDEKQRRRGEFLSSQITPPSSQQRPPCPPTESEIFFKKRIQENLRLMNSQHQENSPASLDNSTSINTSIPYPVEVPEGSNLMNASYLDTHIVSSGVILTNSRETNLNESFVDESLVLSMMSGSQKRSQNDSVILDSQDMMFAEVLGELQEDQVRVDDDSVLGSQLEKNCTEDDTDFLGVNHEIVNTILEKNALINSDETASKETRQMWQESFWSGVDADCAIPQLDGTLESPDSTPGTSTNEPQQLLDLVQPPNYWPFPELAALEPCDEGQSHNGNCEPCEEDLMDLSYSTATYSNISEPYNRVLLGDPAFTLPPSATPSELGDCVQIMSNEFGSNDQHFEGELLENLNFPDIGDLLEPNLGFSPIKERPYYSTEMNGSPAKIVSPKSTMKRKHSKASKAIMLSQQQNGTLGGPAISRIDAGTVGTDDVFQHPQQPVPCTNGGYYYHQPVLPNAPPDKNPGKKAKKVKKVPSKQKSDAMPLMPKTAEKDIQSFENNDIAAAATPAIKVSSKRKSVSGQFCLDMACYEEVINNAVIRGIEESEESSECDLPPENSTSPHLSLNGNAPEETTVVPHALVPENGTFSVARYDDAINDDVNRAMNGCTEREVCLVDDVKLELQEAITKPDASGAASTSHHVPKVSGISTQSANIITKQDNVNTPPANSKTLRGDIELIATQRSTDNKTVLGPTAYKADGGNLCKQVCNTPRNALKKSIGTVLHNKTLSAITITAVNRKDSVVPDQTLSQDPSVLRTKALSGISLTVNKKNSVPDLNRNVVAKHMPACSMVPIANGKKMSAPKMLPLRPPISSLNTPINVRKYPEHPPMLKAGKKKRLSNEDVLPSKCDQQTSDLNIIKKTDVAGTQLTNASAVRHKPSPMNSKTVKAHVRSPLALVRREDDLTLAQLMKLEKTKEKSSAPEQKETVIPSPVKPSEPGNKVIQSDFFETAVSKSTSLTVERTTSVVLLNGNSMVENIKSLDERCTMTVKDSTEDSSGIDCCLKVVKNSWNDISLADFLSRMTDVYNDPNATRITLSKGICEKKFNLEVVEIQAVAHDILTQPEPDLVTMATQSVCAAPMKKVPDTKLALPKITLKRSHHKRKPSYKLVLDKRRKAPLSLASREIMDARLIALFETRTGQVFNPFNRTAAVKLRVMSKAQLKKYRLEKVHKQFKIPCVDGGVDSDSSSSDDGSSVSASQPRTPKRRKGRYRPLAVQYEKSPKSEAGGPRRASPGNAVAQRKRPKRASYGTLDVKFDKSPSARRSSQIGASSSSCGIQPNCKHPAAFPPDASIPRLPLDDLEAPSCKISESNCDDTIRSVQSETGCDQVSFIEDAAGKTAKKKLTFPSSSVNQEVHPILNIASNSPEPNISETFPERRSSFDIFQESDSPQMFPSSGDIVIDSCAQSPIDTTESICALELVSDDEINDLGIVSFYDNTHIFTSPSDTTFHGSPESSDIISSGEAPIKSKFVKEYTCRMEPVVHHQEPFYSDPADVTAGLQVGHRIVKLPYGPSQNIQNQMKASAWHGRAIITPCQLPPTFAEVERWVEAKKLLRALDSEKGANRKVEDTNSLSSQGVTEETASEVSIPFVSESPPSPKVNLLESTNSTSTPQKTRHTRMISPTYTPIIEVKTKLRSSKRKSLVARSFKPREPSIEEVDESSQSPKSSPGDIAVPSTSKETPQRVAKRRRSSIISNEDPSLHKLLLQSQFRQQLATPRRLSSGCQIEGVQNNTFGFRMSLENLQDAKALTQHQHLSVMSMELHVQTRGDLRPDPAHDPVRAVFYFVVNDVPDTSPTPKHESGALVVCDTEDFLAGCGLPDHVHRVSSERELMDQVVALVRRTDPDIFCGYETEMLSWGYLIQRAATLQINLCPLLSRIPTTQRESRRDPEETDGAIDGPSDLRLPGRVLLNVWRLMKSEIPLMNYSFENVMFHVLHQRVPLHSFRSLSQWWEHRSKRLRWLTADYYETRVRGMVRIMDQLDLIGRTSELARIFGIQFYEVLSRGSQFRVESMMLRLAKPLNYVPVSPSIHQRAQMRAPECVPLIMEPESAFYADPVIVLDFQSLYPSIIIAYNYCFSTCLGRVEHLGKREPFAFGCTSLKVAPRLVEKLRDRMNVSPNGVAFVQESVRRGVLPRMLQEILDTRLMVKKSMKEHAGDKTLQRVLHSRQLGLKLIANVTYGYTSANYSGRMPCIEVGDSVVSKGRETLERAIRMVQQTERWGAKVVYGDTDSLFVLVKGRSREQAFAIGAEIAEAVTRDNPKPVKLKLEKVYHPCILQTKKRYVGYLYESAEEREPRYDAKGIETVRRDGCPAVAKMLEKCLRLLFETRDASLVKRYVLRQFDKLLRGRANVQDLVFAREYRGMPGYKPGACVPALELTRRWIRADRRSEPRVGERVPYVIVAGAPGLPLIRLVRSPHELLADPSLRINAIYYITRAIVPALNRCLLLIGADALAWFASMPRKAVSYLPTSAPTTQKKSTISQYFATTDCAACARPTSTGLCAECATRPQETVLALADKVRAWERNHARITQVCESCVGRSYGIDCMSLDCPVMFRKYQAFRDLEQAPFVRRLIDEW